MKATLKKSSTLSLSLSLALLVTGANYVAVAGGVEAATGDVTPFALSSPNSAPEGLALDGGGNIWIALSGVNQIVKSTPVGALTSIDISSGTTNVGAHSIALGPDARMWLTERIGNRIGAINIESNQYQSYEIPTPNSEPMGITTGPDGALWFTQFASDKIGRVTKDGKFTEFPLPAQSGPTSLVTGPDGALWITLQTSNKIGRMTTSGVLTPYALPTANSAPTDITLGSDNNLWFTERDGNRIGRISVQGVLAEFTLPTSNSKPEQITQGPSGELWITQPGANRISRVTNSGVATEFILPTANTNPFGLVLGVDGNIWFTGKSTNNVNRLLSGVIPVPNVAPTLGATSTKTGATVSATPGQWKYLPTSYTYQWERCTNSTNSTCQAIPGATASTYVLTDADAGNSVRVSVKATNLNGTSVNVDSSTRLAIDGLAPKLPPTPVVGGQSVQLVAGVTATLKGAKVAQRGKSKLFRVLVSNNAVKGKVRMVLINQAGLEVFVIAPGKWIDPSGKAKKIKRIPRSLPVGLYTLQAVYTPRANLATTYPVATMSKPIRIK